MEHNEGTSGPEDVLAACAKSHTFSKSLSYRPFDGGFSTERLQLLVGYSRFSNSS